MDISVILSTYNRCELLPEALQSLSDQQANGVEYEIIVVDNNSTDRTKEVVEQFKARNSRIRYVFEGRQGLSYGRNAGIQVAHADAIAFTDDDVQVATDWILSIQQALSQYPDAEFLGGRVLPLFEDPLPVWAHTKMPPLALQDLGNEPLVLSNSDRRCLIGACLIARRRALARAGLFSTETQRVKDGVGSTEDADWESLVWNYGGHGVYVPGIVVQSPVSSDRLTKSYHRKWHLGHGRFIAKTRRFEAARAREFFEVPMWMYRQAVESCAQFATTALKRRKKEAFEHETVLLFSLGFIAERWKAHFFAHQPARHAAPVNSPAH